MSSFADIFVSRSPGLMPEYFRFNMLRESKETLVGWGPSFVAPDRPDQVSIAERRVPQHSLAQLSITNNFAEGEQFR